MALRGLITMSEAAQKCDMTRQRLHQLYCHGKFLRPMKIGGVNVWDENEVTLWDNERIAAKIKRKEELSKRDLRYTKRGLLSPRETEVIELLCKGVRTSEIAVRMKIKPSTLHVFLRHIRFKLNVHSNEDAILRALDLGIIDEKQ